MSKLQEIYDGWKNFVFPSKEVEELAKKRMAICIDCSKLSRTNTCLMCGCYMPAKTRSETSTCRLGKW